MNAPTLLIGLGGTGCKIIERVARMATPEQNENISYAVFDTDINDLRGIRERNPFIKTIQTSTKQTVGEYLNKDVHARDTWFPVNAILNGKTLTEGAGQVRSISRLALETVIRAGKMEPLHEAIQDLFKVEGNKADQALRIEIVSSLAGGTGSGLILPVALYVRHYLDTNFHQSANITRGFFILPEVFYEVIPGQSERNNLKANAYATLKELDAFLMKGDHTLPERYAASVRLQFPRTAAEGYEEYDIRPYDFCFLFDAQNADGAKLNSFEQYLDHAANCIYAQSIGPMNKRSNSSEDNTILKLAGERGRNRYAGAGASRLIYPFEDIRTYIALNWAKQCVSARWMKYDDLYREARRENEKQQENGYAAAEISFPSFYVNQIEQDANADDGFAKAIVRATGKYKNAVTRESDNWTTYVNTLLRKVEKDLNAGSPDLNSRYNNVEMMIEDLKTSWEPYVDAYEEMEEYRLLSETYTASVAPTMAYSLFKGSEGVSESLPAEFTLEYYMTNSEGNFIHPNAIRYLLIKIYDYMKRTKENLDGRRRKASDDFRDFEKNTFDDPSTDVEEGAEDLRDRKTKILTRITRRPSSEQEDIKSSLMDNLKAISKYNVMCAQSEVLSQGMDYINSMIEAFDSLYKTMGSKIEGIDKRIANLHKKYTYTKGTTVRYVSASPECLDKILSKKTYTGGVISIDSELAKKIYATVRAYSLMSEKPSNNRYFSDLFDAQIIGYFEKSVMQSYGTDLDVDIITAMENEASYVLDLENMGETEAANRVNQYVRQTIQETRNLSCPFIESPRGESRDPIHSCTFNEALVPEGEEETARAQLIRSELMNFGGEPDEDTPINTIMFYQAFYALRANDLSKFAPAEVTPTFTRSPGEYFKAYYERVADINPEPHKSRAISPHIDRWWHIVTKMPDLDDANQKKMEDEIYAAFFWAMLNNYIVYQTEEGTGARVYKIKNIRLNMESDTLVTSNGTPCDRLYEVLDAIAIYPFLTRRILDAVKAETQNEINKATPFEKSSLARKLKSFRVKNPGLGDEGKPAHSIFDLPLLMKKSSTPEVYYEDDVIELLRVELEVIRDYLKDFCSEAERPGIFAAIVLKEFDLHLESVKIERESSSKTFSLALFEKTCDVIANALNEEGLSAEADQIQEKAAEF